MLCIPLADCVKTLPPLRFRHPYASGSPEQETEIAGFLLSREWQGKGPRKVDTEFSHSLLVDCICDHTSFLFEIGRRRDQDAICVRPIRHGNYPVSRPAHGPNAFVVPIAREIVNPF